MFIEIIEIIELVEFIEQLEQTIFTATISVTRCSNVCLCR
jgi:hypothetical protein